MTFNADVSLTDTQLRASAVPVSQASQPLPTGAATSANQTSGGQKTQIVNGAGTTLSSVTDPSVGVALFACNITKGTAISQGLLTGHRNYRGFGYDPAIAATITDVSGRSAPIVYPTTATLPYAVSTSANDTGTILKKSVATGGSTTVLIDTTGTSFITLGIVAGDVVLNDTDVTNGIVVTVDSAIQLTIRPVAPATYSGKNYRIVRAASTGGSVIEIHSLAANFTEQSEYIVMNGVTPVAGTKTMLRINNSPYMAVGSLGVPAGNTSIQNVGVTQIYSYIGAGLNMCLQAGYTVPAGYNMFMSAWHGGSSGNKPLRILLRATADFHDRALTAGVFHVQDLIMALNGDQQHRFELPLKFPPQCDVKISANVIGAGTGECGCGFEFWIEPI